MLQLMGLFRATLRSPYIWYLDHPTLDETWAPRNRCISAVSLETTRVDLQQQPEVVVAELQSRDVLQTDSRPTPCRRVGLS